MQSAKQTSRTREVTTKTTMRNQLTILGFLMLVLSACTSELSTTEGSNSVPVATQTTEPTNQNLTTAAPTATVIHRLLWDFS